MRPPLRLALPLLLCPLVSCICDPLGGSDRSCSHPSQIVNYQVTGNCGGPATMEVYTANGSCYVGVDGGVAGVPTAGGLGDSFDLNQGGWWLDAPSENVVPVPCGFCSDAGSDASVPLATALVPSAPGLIDAGPSDAGELDAGSTPDGGGPAAPVTNTTCVPITEGAPWGTFGQTAVQSPGCQFCAESTASLTTLYATCTPLPPLFSERDCVTAAAPDAGPGALWLHCNEGVTHTSEVSSGCGSLNGFSDTQTACDALLVPIPP